MYDGYTIIPNGRPTWAPLLAASGQQLAVSIRSPTNHASWTCYVYRHLFAAGRPSRVGPYDCRIVATDIHFIACMRYRRGRPKGVPLWEFRKMLSGENTIRRPPVAGRSQQAVHRTAS